MHVMQRFMECMDLRNQVHWMQRKLLMMSSHHNDLELSTEQQVQPSTLPTAADQLLPDQSQTAPLAVSPEASYLNEGVGSSSNAESSQPKEYGIKHEVTSPTPEPRSLHSSPAHAHKTRRSRSRKGRSRHQSKGGTLRGGGGFEPPETYGTFTSAAPTPDSQRNILIESHEEHVREEGKEEEEQEVNPHSKEENLDVDPNLEAEPGSPQPSQDRLAPTQFIESHSKSWLNEWGLYQTIRLLQIKNRLMLPVIRLRQRKERSQEEGDNI